MTTLHFDDGYIRFSIGGEPTEYAVDSLSATMAAEELAAKHELPIRDGMFVFTDAFCDELCEVYSQRFNLPPVSRVVANRIWLAAQLDVQGLKKKHERAARIARSYGINPFELTTGQQIALLANLPKIEAQELCKSGSYDDSEPEKVLELWRFAFEDEELAQAKATEAARRLIERETRKR